MSISDIQLSSNTPAADSGYRNAKLRISGSAPNPTFASFEVPNSGGTDPRTTTTETIVMASNGKLVRFTNASAIAVTLDSTVPNLFRCFVQVTGAGTATFTPSSGTINGAESQAIAGGTSPDFNGGILFFNGTNWWLITGGGSASPLTTKGDLYSYSTTNARLPIGADNTVLMADSSQTTGNGWKTPRGNTFVPQLADSTGGTTSGHIAVFDANGNVKDGGAIGSGGGVAPSTGEFILGAQDTSDYANSVAIPGLYGSADVQPVSAGSFDDEFPGSALSGSWTWLNQAGAVATVSNSRCFITTDVSTGTPNAFRGIYRALPVGTWQADMKFTPTPPVNGTNPFLLSGFLLYESGTGKIVWFGPFFSPYGVYVGYGTGTGAVNTYLASIAHPWQVAQYLRVSYDGTNLNFFMSPDGTSFGRSGAPYYTMAANAHFTTKPDNIGFGAAVYAGTAPVLICDWIRRTA